MSYFLPFIKTEYSFLLQVESQGCTNTGKIPLRTIFCNKTKKCGAKKVPHFFIRSIFVYPK